VREFDLPMPQSFTPTIDPIASQFVQLTTMNLSSYASTWKTSLEDDTAREKSASSFPAIAPTGIPIGGTRLSSLQQHATKGWKQQQHLQQQHLQQQKDQLQQTQSAQADDHWGTGTDSPSMKHPFQPYNNHNHTSNETKSGWSDQRDTSHHSCGNIWADTASGWSNQRDMSQHSRGGIRKENQSRSSHNSTSTGTTPYTETYSSHGTHPFATTTAASTTTTPYTGTCHGTHPFATATAANPAAPSYTGTSGNHPFATTTTATTKPATTSRINHRNGYPLLGDLGKISLAGVATTQQMRVGSVSTGGRTNIQYYWSPQQQYNRSSLHKTSRTADSHLIIPQALQMNDNSFGHTMPSDDEEDESQGSEDDTQGASGYNQYQEKEWLLRMNQRLAKIPFGELDAATMPLSMVMNTWAKTKSSEGASMVEMWLKRVQQEYDAGNHRVVPTAKMYTMAGTWLLWLSLLL
jgi:hypothetical protein